ncbi:MAG: cobyric acid synthase [Desulfovibrio sp.]|nr:cobyric acid synthase [Desulfovibrio sp.]
MHRPPALMIQGTCSNAGKSLLATAICRNLTLMGFRVRPFKAQNMSLNAFVADDGEMGLAQAIQARACGISPDCRMNPLLLKPLGNATSELICLGKPHGTLTAKDFASFRPDLWSIVQKAYCSLAEEADIMVLEGAGSPAEINLREHDLVNMRMAHFAKAKVLLTCDIDRGGAFAALLGTMLLLQPDEQALVSGFIINKFRGDSTLLTPAMEEIRRRTNRPFFGIIPWIDAVDIPDEDSVSLSALKTKRAAPPNTLDIAFIKLPHLSNAQDLDSLRKEADVSLRPIESPETFGCPDLVILPGSRNTMAAMRFLTLSGLDQAIHAYARENPQHGMILGICCGMQLLGESIHDPFGMEEGCSIRGLNLLPLKTHLAKQKIQRKTQAISYPPLTPSPLPLFGQEMRYGQTSPSKEDILPLIRNENGEVLGFGRMDHDTIPILGTSLHGLFDADAFRAQLLKRLRDARGLPNHKTRHYDISPSIDRLAAIVDQAMPVKSLLALLGLQSS